MGRTHQWIRVERYWEGEFPNIRARFMPVMCQQCDAAPCEPVCPVNATYHTPDGLNAQVYNRCVGTRFCANNCPYTVRYFTWFTPEWPSPLNEQLNPDVSIRTSGIMEKCTFCVQRIRRAQDTAKDETRAVRDGEIQPACAQACPAKVLVFGDLSDPEQPGLAARPLAPRLSPARRARHAAARRVSQGSGRVTWRTHTTLERSERSADQSRSARPALQDGPEVLRRWSRSCWRVDRRGVHRVGRPAHLSASAWRARTGRRSGASTSRRSSSGSASATPARSSRRFCASCRPNGAVRLRAAPRRSPRSRSLPDRCSR